MKFSNHHIKLHLEIQEALLDELYQRGLSHYPKEYGGLLIGRYTDDRLTAVIEKTILPKRYKASRYYFERGSEGLKEELEALYQHEPKLFYIGEWHTHPDGPVDPSGRDKATMAQLVKDKNVFINNPILLIMAITKKDYCSGFFVQHGNALHPFQS